VEQFTVSKDRSVRRCLKTIQTLSFFFDSSFALDNGLFSSRHLEYKVNTVQSKNLFVVCWTVILSLLLSEF